MNIKITPQPIVDKSQNLSIQQQSFAQSIEKTTKKSLILGSKKHDEMVNFSNPLDITKSNSLLDVVLNCYNNHLALKLTPDVIFISLLIQFATYVNNNADKLFTKFFMNPEKDRKFVFESGNELSTFRFDIMFNSFASQLKSEIKDPLLNDTFNCNFSTSTSTDKYVSQLLLAATVSSYYKYHGYPLCGVPEIEISGTKEDWMNILKKLKTLEKYDAGDKQLLRWLDMVYPIIDKFVQIYDNEPDIDFWSRMIRRIEGGSGVNHIDGWLVVFAFFRLNDLTTHKSNLEDHQPYYLMFENKQIVYPFVHYDKLPSGVLSFNVEMFGWGNPFVANVFVGQCLFDVTQTDQLVPSNDWFVISDFATCDTNNSHVNHLDQLDVSLNQSIETFITNEFQLLDLMNPYYDSTNWENYKFVCGKPQEFLHFVVSVIDSSNVDLDRCVKCSSHGSFFCQVFLGAKIIDSFNIQRQPLFRVSHRSTLYDPYIVPFLRQWVECNFQCSSMLQFKLATNAHVSLGWLKFGMNERHYDGSVGLYRLEIPISQMNRISHNHYNHEFAQKFDHYKCLCLNAPKKLNLSSMLQVSLYEFHETERWGKTLGCSYCFYRNSFRLVFQLGTKILDDIIILIPYPLIEELPEADRYQFIFQWLINNCPNLDPLNTVPLCLKDNYSIRPGFKSLYFSLNSVDLNHLINIKMPNHNLLPIWMYITEDSIQKIKFAMCKHLKDSKLELVCLETENCFITNKKQLNWQLSHIKFFQNGNEIVSELSRQIHMGTHLIEKDQTHLNFLQHIFGVNLTEFDLIQNDKTRFTYLIPVVEANKMK